MKRIIVLAALAAALPSMIRAQETTTASAGVMQVSLKEAIDYAMSYNKQLQASKMDTELYHQKVREALSGGLPQVSASLTGTTYFGSELNFGGQKMKMENAMQLSATASYTFSMQQIASVKLSKIAASITEQQIASNELNVKANLIDTYYATLIYQRNVEIIKANLADMEGIYNHTSNMYEAGVVETTDVDQMRINVSTLKNALISTERSMEVTKRLLALQMGVPVGTKVEATTSLEDLIVDRTVTALDSSSFDIHQNIDYKTLELSNKASEQSVKMCRMAHLPTLTAAYQYTNNLKGGFMSFDHVGNLTLNVPIFTGFKRHSQLKQAEIELKKGETNLSLLTDNLLQNEEQYRFELNSAIDSYLLQKENLEVAKRILNNYKNKYNEGALSSLDLTQANTNYLQAETSFATACLELLTAHTKLNKLYNNFEY